LTEITSIRCRTIISAAFRLPGRGLGICPVAVDAELESSGEIDAAGGTTFLASLPNGHLGGDRLPFLLKQLRDLPAPGEADLPDVGDESNRTDVGAGRALVSLHGHDLRYIHGEGWHVWHGHRWATYESGQVQ